MGALGGGMGSGGGRSVEEGEGGEEANDRI
jgi:hypothetical protein